MANVPIPTSFSPTHNTDGLAGFPARDFFGSPGDTVLAPAPGKIIRLSGKDPSLGGTPGGAYGESLYLQTAQGVYFITHLASRLVGVGDTVSAGTPIGTIADAAVVGSATSSSHTHVGFHLGLANVGGGDTTNYSGGGTSTRDVTAAPHLGSGGNKPGLQLGSLQVSGTGGGGFTDAAGSVLNLAASGNPLLLGPTLLGGGNIFTGIGTLLSTPTKIVEFLGKLSDPNFWIRVLQIIGGALLFGSGLYLLARQVGLSEKIEGAVPAPVKSAALAAAVK